MNQCASAIILLVLHSSHTWSFYAASVWNVPDSDRQTHHSWRCVQRFNLHYTSDDCRLQNQRPTACRFLWSRVASFKWKRFIEKVYSIRAATCSYPKGHSSGPLRWPRFCSRWLLPKLLVRCKVGEPHSVIGCIQKQCLAVQGLDWNCWSGRGPCLQLFP